MNQGFIVVEVFSFIKYIHSIENYCFKHLYVMVAWRMVLLTASSELCPQVGALKTRLRLTEKQLEVLENIYASNQYPNSSLIKELCKELNLEWDTVNMWFRNSRVRSKIFCSKILIVEYLHTASVHSETNIDVYIIKISECVICSLVWLCIVRFVLLSMCIELPVQCSYQPLKEP